MAQQAAIIRPPSMDAAQPQGPGLFGISRSNRDLTRADSWGKNQFNSTFPVALANYMYSQGLEAVYLVLNEAGEVDHQHIPVDAVFGLDPLSDETYFNFESTYQAFAPLIGGVPPRVDLVVGRWHDETLSEVRPLEIKLTAIPDNTTRKKEAAQFGTELVIRTPSITYLALAIARGFENRKEELRDLVLPLGKNLETWTDRDRMFALFPQVRDTFEQVLIRTIELQVPFLLQPIWKTVGTSLKLENQCLDLFVWTNYAFARLFLRPKVGTTISRPMRTLLWVMRMLYDFAAHGECNRLFIDQMAFGPKNDKAFAVPGSVSNTFMRCDELTSPRVPKTALRSIILGGGQLFLNPERRFDAAVLGSPELFDGDV